jgi:hypothetical protein
VVAHFAGVLFYILQWLLQHMPSLDLEPRPGKPESLMPSGQRLPEELPQMVQPVTVPPEFLIAFKVILAIIAGAIIIWLLTRAVSRLGWWQQREDVDEIHDFVLSRGDLEGMWKGLWANARSKMRRLAPSGERTSRRASTSIRELYREFLALGDYIGRARFPAETPAEYQRRLRRDEPLTGTDDVRVITESYVEARYAPPVAPSPDAQPVAAAIARLRILWVGRGQGRHTS